MITLKTDKGLVRVETWEQLPGFVAGLDPESTTLKTIAGVYAFPAPLKCGVATCGQSSGKGYVVTMTDSRLTNVGKDCGKTHFPGEFDNLRRAFDGDLRSAERREQLRAFQALIPGYLEKISNLRGGRNADWIYKTSRMLTRDRYLAQEITAEVTRMVKGRSDEIRQERRVSEQEVEVLEAMEGRKIERPHRVVESLGTLSGISVLFPENDLRQILIMDIVAGLNRVAGLNVDALSEHQLSLESKWITAIESKIEAAERVVQEGQRLLRRSNISQFEPLIKKHVDKKTFQDYLRTLPD